MARGTGTRAVLHALCDNRRSAAYDAARRPPASRGSAAAFVFGPTPAFGPFSDGRAGMSLASLRHDNARTQGLEFFHVR